MYEQSEHSGSCCVPSAARARPAARRRGIGRAVGSIRGMVELPGGKFLMGADDPSGFPADGEGPVREIEVDPFHVGATAVTNGDFSRFVKSTRYVTEAERFGWSFVFHLLLTPRARRAAAQAAAGAPWWARVAGASWRHPDGPGSHVKDRMDHPAVHVSWNDAMAYCEWSGSRLPTEAEWEYAARGGLEQKTYPWGDELTPGGEHVCNIWQGEFPDSNTAEDGYVGTAPASAFPPNGFGLHNVAGNVWEWTADWFSATHHAEGPRRNPTGPESGDAIVTRGGSYLCHESYCNRYRVAARTSNTPDSSTGNTGFRCASDRRAPG